MSERPVSGTDRWRRRRLNNKSHAVDTGNLRAGFLLVVSFSSRARAKHCLALIDPRAYPQPPPSDVLTIHVECHISWTPCGKILWHVLYDTTFIGFWTLWYWWRVICIEICKLIISRLLIESIGVLRYNSEIKKFENRELVKWLSGCTALDNASFITY